MNVDFPNITTTVYAKPWPAGHVARITSTRVTCGTPRKHKVIESYIVPDEYLN